MAHLIASLNLTPGGRCHHLDAVVDEAHHRYAQALLEPAQALLLGGHTYALFTEFWPAASQREDLPESLHGLAQALDRITKVVLSRSPLATSWAPCQRLSEADLQGLKRWLDSVDGTVVMLGSPTLLSLLLEQGWVDELHLLLQPLLGGQPPQALAGLQRRPLSLLEAQPWPSGAVLLRYKPQ